MCHDLEVYIWKRMRYLGKNKAVRGIDKNFHSRRVEGPEPLCDASRFVRGTEIAVLARFPFWRDYDKGCSTVRDIRFLPRSASSTIRVKTAYGRSGPFKALMRCPEPVGA